MASLALWCFRHRRTVVIGWLAVIAVLVGLTASIGTAYSDSFSLPGTESTKALSLLTSAFPAQAGDSETIVVHVNSGSVRDPAVQSKVSSMLAQVARSPSVASVASPYARAGVAQVSRDGRTAFASVNFAKLAQELPKADVQHVIDLAESARSAGLDVELGGNAIKQIEQTPPSNRLSKPHPQTAR